MILLKNSKKSTIVQIVREQFPKHQKSLLKIKKKIDNI